MYILCLKNKTIVAVIVKVPTHVSNQNRDTDFVVMPIYSLALKQFLGEGFQQFSNGTFRDHPQIFSGVCLKYCVFVCRLDFADILRQKCICDP